MEGVDTVYCTNYVLQQEVDDKKLRKRAKTFSGRNDMHKELQRLNGDITIINQYGLIQGKYVNLDSAKGQPTKTQMLVDLDENLNERSHSSNDEQSSEQLDFQDQKAGHDSDSDDIVINELT